MRPLFSETAVNCYIQNCFANHAQVIVTIVLFTCLVFFSMDIDAVDKAITSIILKKPV